MTDHQTAMPNAILDRILGLQIMVAWCGEAGEKRMGWWRSRLTDPLEGADFFSRATPEAAAWTGLDAVRRAAIFVDARCRRRLGTPDAVRTLFFLGYEVDEKLRMRLGELKRISTPPHVALDLPLEIEQPLDRAGFQDFLDGLGEKEPVTIMPAGRQLKGELPESLERMSARLAVGLLPLAPEYPMPFFRLRG